MLNESRRIFATFGVNLEHESLDQSFLPTNQHCFGGREGGRREGKDSPELLKMLWSFSKIRLFVSVPTNFGQDLGPALASIFVGFHESRLFDNTVKRGVYFPFVDDTFAIFGSELGIDHFQEKLNLLHPALKFTVEKEQNNFLNFLDVLVEKEGTEFLTSIYRKPTFTGQYIRWNSFSPKMRKN